MSKYHREVSSTSIDVYDVLVAWDVRNPAIQHAIKKLLQPGNRGHKDTIQDLVEAIQSIERGIVIERNSIGKSVPNQDEWITWGGGAIPVDANVHVHVRYRDGEIMTRRLAGECDWTHGIPGTKQATHGKDIVAYRIVKEPS